MAARGYLDRIGSTGAYSIGMTKLPKAPWMFNVMSAGVKADRKARIVGVALSALLLVWSATAAAEPDSAQEWNAVGVRHRSRLEPEKALEAFRKAHQLAPSPKSRGQMGFVEHDLGQFTAAEQHLAGALAAHKDPWVIKNRRFLAEALAMTRLRLGHVSVRGPAGATVRVQGAPVGTLPLSLPLSLPEGETWIAVAAPGHLPWEQRLTITGGKELEVVADLVPDRGDLPDITHPPPDRHVEGGPGRPPTLGDQAPGTLTPDPHPRAVAWTLVGVGAALAGAAVWSFTTRGPSCPGASPGGRICNQAPRASWPGMAFAGTSVLALAAGITLFVW
jgi:hypothetical protein